MRFGGDGGDAKAACPIRLRWCFLHTQGWTGLGIDEEKAKACFPQAQIVPYGPLW
jgi:hypothetical protein